MKLTKHQQDALKWIEPDKWFDPEDIYEEFCLRVRRPYYTACLLWKKGILERKVIEKYKDWPIFVFRLSNNISE